MGGIVPLYFDTVGGALQMLPSKPHQGARDERREAIAADAGGADACRARLQGRDRDRVVRVLRAGEDAAGDRRAPAHASSCARSTRARCAASCSSTACTRSARPRRPRQDDARRHRALGPDHAGDEFQRERLNGAADRGSTRTHAAAQHHLHRRRRPRLRRPRLLRRPRSPVSPVLDRLAAERPALHAGLRQLAGVLADALRADDRRATSTACAARPRSRSTARAAAARRSACRPSIRRCLAAARSRLSHRARSASGTSATRRTSARCARLRRILRADVGRRRLLHATAIRAACTTCGEGDAEHRRAGYLTDLISHARRRLHRARRGAAAAPFLLSLHYTAPHWPWETRDDGGARGRGQGQPLSPRRRQHPHLPAHDPSHGRRHRPDHGRARRAGASTDDTLVVFTSDNGGERFSDSWPLVGGKMDLTEGGIRVPWIAHWPRAHRRPAATSEQLCMTMDWTATMLEAAGVAADPDYPLDGVSLLPVLRRSGHDVRAAAALAHEPPRPARAAPGPLEVPAGSTSTNICSTSRADERERANRGRREPERLAAMRAAWQAWNATMPPIPADATVSLGYGAEGHAAALAGPGARRHDEAIRSARSRALRRRPGRRLRAGARRAGARPEGEPLDVVRLSAAEGARPQRARPSASASRRAPRPRPTSPIRCSARACSNARG